jgi:hypothetical protein
VHSHAASRALVLPMSGRAIGDGPSSRGGHSSKDSGPIRALDRIGDVHDESRGIHPPPDDVGGWSAWKGPHRDRVTSVDGRPGANLSRRPEPGGLLVSEAITLERGVRRAVVPQVSGAVGTWTVIARVGPDTWCARARYPLTLRPRDDRSFATKSAPSAAVHTRGSGRLWTRDPGCLRRLLFGVLCDVDDRAVRVAHEEPS